MLKTEHQTSKAEVFGADGSLVINDVLVPLEHLREEGPAYRIGVDFLHQIDKGLINEQYMQIL